MKRVLWICAMVACLGGTGAMSGAGFQQAAEERKPVGDQAQAGPVVSEKQKKLLEDMDKLVQMAAELKVSVDKSNKNELSLEVVRKAEAVEKLAKSVKERIREAR